MKRPIDRTPAALRSLAPDLRAKALRLASVLHQRGVPQDRALQMSAERTRMWARRNVESEGPALHARSGRQSIALPENPSGPARGRLPSEPEPIQSSEPDTSRPRRRSA